jgi:drug/metabolite transporter (DMT)-like permease
VKKQPALIVLALLAVYFIWGSTYLAMRFAVMAIPPLLMAGVRYLIAGGTILIVLWLLKKPLPTRRQWLHAGWVGVLLLLGGNGAVCLALERGVSSGLSALVLAVTPLFILVIGYFWGQRAAGREWLGIALGIAGIVILNFGRELSASPLAGSLLIFAAVSWSLGSVWGRRLDQPSGFMASAVQMIVGGLALLLAAALHGESLQAWPATKTLWAMAYLIFVGAILGFSSYVYLLATVRPALAISYAYVNPVVAVALGVMLGGEQVDAQELWAMVVILAGVVLVCLPKRESMTAVVAQAES